MMAHAYGLTDEELAVLADPRRWRLSASGCCDEVERVTDDAAHRRWSHAHTHAHAHAELLLALSGDVPYRHPQGVLRCVPGACLWFDAMEAHDDGYPSLPPSVARPPVRLGFSHLWIGIAGDYAFAHLIGARDGRAIARPLVARPATSAEIGVDLALTVARWRSLAARDAVAGRLTLLGALQLVVARLLTEADAGDDAAGGGDRAIEAVRQHLHATAGAGVSLDGLARLVGYSKFHLARRFRAVAGCTIGAYIDRCRIEALRRLRKDGRGFAEVAAALGFSSPSALSRWCRRHGVRWRAERGGAA